jgi:hypothetical protein
VPLHEAVAWIEASNDDTLDCRKVRVIELRYFLGYTTDEAASRATIDRDFALGKAWLHRRLLARV